METKTIVVHSGAFHADDLFAVAVAERFLEKEGYTKDAVRIIRTRDKEIILKGDIVLDVGGVFDTGTLRFDHHQEGGSGTRDNGIPYAAFGLTWRALGEKITGSSYVVRRVDEKLAQTMDALDNGIDVFGEPEMDIPHRYILQSVFRSLQPTWKEKGYTTDDAFFKALEIARVILDREIIHAGSEEEGSVQVLERYAASKDSYPGLLVLDDHYPYGEVAESHPEIMFVVKPSEDEKSWKARSIRSNKNGFHARKLFPKEWAGKRDEELARVTGVSDAIFVHNKRFIAIALSKEGALALAQKALKH